MKELTFEQTPNKNVPIIIPRGYEHVHMTSQGDFIYKKNNLYMYNYNVLALKVITYTVFFRIKTKDTIGRFGLLDSPDRQEKRKILEF